MKSLAFAALLLTATPAMAVTAPSPSIATLAELPVTVMQPYDEAANANAQVADAFGRAKKSHKRVLIDLGGNWCPDCIILANFMKLPEMHRFVEAHYEIVAVDVGRFNKNLQIPARFGFTARLTGVPTVLIATPDGKLVNRDNVFATSDARHMTPQALSEYLARYAN
ncbi:MAG TPA: thioredoxin family protein [Rhizomicrobium sp.]|jgi:thiol-disulfide isomerase/thioredoxin